FTVPYQFTGTAGAASGPGDVFLNYRYQALFETPRQPACAPRLSLILPTGSDRDGLGSGSPGMQLDLPLSKQPTHVATHLNLGTTIVPHALAPHGRSELLASWNVGASLVWLLADAINPLVEVVVSRDQDVGRRAVTTATHATLNPGVRVG